MTEPLQLDLNHLRQWIGRSEEAHDVITSRLVKGLLVTISDSSPDPVKGMEAPLAVHWCLAPPTVPMAQLGPDGHPARGGFLPPVPLPRRMWAGGRLEFHDRLRVADTVTRRSSISDVTAKPGRTGTLCFVTVDHEISTTRGLAIRERQDIVYRSAEPARLASPAATPAQPQPGLSIVAAQHSRTARADPVLLFRYSALTFNGHRIHYDRSYCIDVESYPGLVVHGPLQATLLLEFAVSLREGHAPSTFEFRSIKPLFDGADFTVSADEDMDGLRLWTAGWDGQPAMKAKAAW
jgi:3-methylfumaryl-CoA hydratase